MCIWELDGRHAACQNQHFICAHPHSRAGSAALTCGINTNQWRSPCSDHCPDCWPQANGAAERWSSLPQSHPMPPHPLSPTGRPRDGLTATALQAAQYMYEPSPGVPLISEARCAFQCSFLTIRALAAAGRVLALAARPALVAEAAILLQGEHRASEVISRFVESQSWLAGAG